MTHNDDGAWQDIGPVRYLDALDGQDFEALAAIWKQAETDPGLEKALIAVNDEVILEHATEPRVPEAPAESFWLKALHHDLVPHSGRAPAEALEASYAAYRCRVLVVDDEPDVLHVLNRLLSPEFDVTLADSAASARAAFQQQPADILLTDLCLAGRSRLFESGVDLMEWVRERSPRTVTLLMTGYGETDSVIEAINRGNVFYYFAKPFPNLELLLETIRRAAHTFTLERKNQELVECLKDLNLELEEKVRLRAGELLARMRELDQKNKTLEKLCLTDTLTGLPNRRAMDHLAEREVQWRRRSPAPLAVGLVDIDFFKSVNTAHGWSGGDRVLTEVARRLSDSLRDIDHLGRYGGEEFMLIAPQADRHGAAVLGERLRWAVEANPVRYRGQFVPVTVSIGIAVIDEDGSADLEGIKDAYESALAAAKVGGRNRCVVHPVAPAERGMVRQAR